MKKPDDDLMTREVIDKEISAGYQLSERDREVVSITVFHLINRFSHNLYENFRIVEDGEWQVAESVYCKYGLLDVLYKPIRQHFCSQCGESVWVYEYDMGDRNPLMWIDADAPIWEQLQKDPEEMRLVKNQIHPPTFCNMWERSYEREFQEAEEAGKPCPDCFSLDTDVNYQEKYFHCDDCGFSGELETDHPYLR